MQSEVVLGIFFYSMESIMTWNKPAFSDLRFGFEITMYIANR